MSAQLTLEVTPGSTFEPTIPARHGWLRRARPRIVQAAREINYANRRLVKVQAPWNTGSQWHRR